MSDFVTVELTKARLTSLARCIQQAVKEKEGKAGHQTIIRGIARAVGFEDENGLIARIRSAERAAETFTVVARNLAERLSKLDTAPDDWVLDDIVYDIVGGKPAANINNGGFLRQIEFICEEWGIEEGVAAVLDAVGLKQDRFVVAERWEYGDGGPLSPSRIVRWVWDQDNKKVVSAMVSTGDSWKPAEPALVLALGASLSDPSEDEVSLWGQLFERGLVVETSVLPAWA